MRNNCISLMRTSTELSRVTKPGGNLSAAVWDYSAGMRMLRTFWDAAVHIDPEAEKLDEKRMPLCRASELSALGRQRGLAPFVFGGKYTSRSSGAGVVGAGHCCTPALTAMCGSVQWSTRDRSLLLAPQ
jgi:hypothetical protein